MTMYKILFIFLFISIHTEACDKRQALETARKYVLKESPKGSKISLSPGPDDIRYTATLNDDLGTYSGIGILKVRADKKGKCEVESIQNSVTNSYKSGTSESYSTSKK